MAIQFIDGFDTYGDGVGSGSGLGMVYDLVASQTTASAVQARTQGHSLRFTPGNTNSRGDLVKRHLPRSMTTGGCACAVYFPADILATVDRQHRFITFADIGELNRLSVLIDNTGRLYVYNNATQSSLGVLVASSATGLFTSGQWYHIEFKFVLSGASSTIQVKLNGADIIPSTAVTLSATSFTVFTPMLKASNAASGTEMFIDDLVVWDNTGSFNNDFVGDVKVATVFPNGNGTPQDFSVAAGPSAWQAISDVAGADSDTTHIISTAVNDKSVFNLGDISSAATILAVQLQTTAAKSDASVCNLRPSVLSGGSEALGGVRSLSTSYVTYADVIERNPNGSVAWTQSTINGAQCAVERVA